MTSDQMIKVLHRTNQDASLSYQSETKQWKILGITFGFSAFFALLRFPKDPHYVFQFLIYNLSF